MRPAPIVLAASAALLLTACGTSASTHAAGGSASASSSTSASPTVGLPTVDTAAAGSTMGDALTRAAVEPPSPIRPGRFAVGDSVMLGAKKSLRAVGFNVTAVVGRQFGAAVGLVATGARAGTLPRNVIVHLGTNGTVTARDCRALVTAAGPQRRVFLVTVKAPRSWITGDNRVIAACASAFPEGRVVVVGWARYSLAHPAFFTRDQIHLQPTGQRAYAALLDAAVDARGL